MTKLMMSAAASALVLASATASFAGNPVGATEEAQPDVFVAATSSVTTPVIIGGIAALVLIAAIAGGDDDAAATTTTGVAVE